MASCPHCQTPLSDPLATQCPSCGVVLPAAGGPPPIPAEAGSEGKNDGQENGQRETGPADGHAREFIATFVETSREVLTRPRAFFQRMPTSGGLGSPLLYAVVAGWIGLAAAAFYQAIWVSIVGRAPLPYGLDAGEIAHVLDWLESWVGLVAQVVLGGVSVAITVFVASGILHLMLLLLGGARRGFEATFRVVCFSQATALLLLVPLFLVPFCGLAVAFWCLTLYVIGLSEAHRIGYGQSLAAVLLPLVVVCCCCVGLAVSFAGAIAGLVGQLP